MLYPRDPGQTDIQNHSVNGMGTQECSLVREVIPYVIFIEQRFFQEYSFP